MGSNSDSIELSKFVADYGDDILRLCIYYMDNNVHDGEDAFQEAMIKAFRARDNFKGKSDSKTWITRIAINTCKDMKKSWYRKNTEPMDESFDIPEIENCNDENNVVYESICGLKAEYKEVLFLRYYRDLTNAQTASVLGLSIPAVCSRVLRAKSELKKILIQKGVGCNEQNHKESFCK